MTSTDLERDFRVILILWIALLAGATAYGVVVWLLASGALGAWEPVLAAGKAFPLLGLAVLPMLAGIAVRRAGSARPADELRARVHAYRTRVIVASAMQEGGGLLGFTLALMAGAAAWVPYLWLLMAAAMFLTRPTRDEFQRLLR